MLSGQPGLLRRDGGARWGCKWARQASLRGGEDIHIPSPSNTCRICYFFLHSDSNNTGEKHHCSTCTPCSIGVLGQKPYGTWQRPCHLGLAEPGLILSKSPTATIQCKRLFRLSLEILSVTCGGLGPHGWANTCPGGVGGIRICRITAVPLNVGVGSLEGEVVIPALMLPLCMQELGTCSWCFLTSSG